LEGLDKIEKIKKNGDEKKKKWERVEVV